MHNVNGGVLVYPLDEIAAYRNGTKQGTDWYDAVMRPLAPQTQHTLSARGGNEKVQYYLSAGYMYQESFCVAKVWITTALIFVPIFPLR